MSHHKILESLHSSLSLETAKLVKWEVETVVNMRDREGQIQQTVGITASQEQLIQQLEGESLRLRGELSAAKHIGEELGQIISHTRREVEVLGSQFIDLQGGNGWIVWSPSNCDELRERDGGDDCFSQEDED